MLDVLFAMTGDARRNSRAIKQLRALAALGARVEVVTFGRDPAPAVIDGEEASNPIPLHVLSPPKGEGPRFFWNADRALRAAVHERPARVYHASDLYALPALAAAARRHRSRLVYDARELYPDVAATAGRPLVKAFWLLLEGLFVRQADAVFTVSDSIADRMRRRYRIERPGVLHNAPATQAPARTEQLRERAGVPAGVPIVLHQGQMRAARGCELLLDAFRDVPDAALVFLGGGPLRLALERQVRTAGLADRVRFLDPVPPDHLLALTASADVGVTLLEDTCLNHRYALPNKLFEYLAAGVPVLASDLPEIRRVVEPPGAGRVVDPADRAALVGALHHLTTDPDARARMAARTARALEPYAWAHGRARFVQTYHHLLAR